MGYGYPNNRTMSSMSSYDATSKGYLQGYAAVSAIQVWLVATEVGNDSKVTFLGYR